jgi:hypothetical protein
MLVTTVQLKRVERKGINMGLKSTTHGVTVAISLAGLKDPAPILRAVMDKVKADNNNARAASVRWFGTDPGTTPVFKAQLL